MSSPARPWGVPVPSYRSKLWYRPSRTPEPRPSRSASRAPTSQTAPRTARSPCFPSRKARGLCTGPGRRLSPCPSGAARRRTHEHSRSRPARPRDARPARRHPGRPPRGRSRCTRGDAGAPCSTPRRRLIRGCPSAWPARWRPGRHTSPSPAPVPSPDRWPPTPQPGGQPAGPARRACPLLAWDETASISARPLGDQRSEVGRPTDSPPGRRRDAYPGSCTRKDP